MVVLFSPSDLYAANLLHEDYYMKSKAKFSSNLEKRKMIPIPCFPIHFSFTFHSKEGYY